MPGPEFVRQPHGPGNIDRRGTAETQTLVLQQIENIGQRFGIRHLAGKIDLRAFEIGGDPRLADTPGDRITPPPQFAILVIVVKRPSLLHICLGRHKI